MQSCRFVGISPHFVVLQHLSRFQVSGSICTQSKSYIYITDSPLDFVMISTGFLYRVLGRRFFCMPLSNTSSCCCYASAARQSAGTRLTFFPMPAIASLVGDRKNHQSFPGCRCTIQACFFVILSCFYLAQPPGHLHRYMANKDLIGSCSLGLKHPLHFVLSLRPSELYDCSTPPGPGIWGHPCGNPSLRVDR